MKIVDRGQTSADLAGFGNPFKFCSFTGGKVEVWIGLDQQGHMMPAATQRLHQISGEVEDSAPVNRHPDTVADDQYPLGSDAAVFGNRHGKRSFSHDD